MSSRLTLKAGIVEEFEFYGEELGGRRPVSCYYARYGTNGISTQPGGANGVGMIVMVIGVCHEYFSLLALATELRNKQTFSSDNLTF